MSSIAAIVDALHRGELVILPTETVYGLAGRADLPEVIEHLRAVKGDRGDKPFSVQVPLGFPLHTLAVVSPEAQAAIDAHWPGPLTLVLPLATTLPGLSGTIGLRCPDHALTQEVLRASGPLAVPSANRSGEPPPQTYAAAVEALLPARFAGLDGGPGSGRPSKVIQFAGTVETLRH